ncbi:MAG: WbqC family protein [Hyphomicrobiales bacterium]|nr:WbqC family protein [Hyphomicrobiales bacterium]
MIPMRLGVMQPYFFPYFGHFALIANVDEWIVFDVTQYTPKTWINRNRVLHPSSGANWVSVPLKNSSISIRIREARVLDLAAAAQSTLGKLSHYRRKAPYAREVEGIVEQTFSAEGIGDSLVRLNVAGLEAVCAYLGVPFRRTICSEMNLTLPDEMGPGDWAPMIAGLVGAGAYLNPIGGRALFRKADFEARGVKLEFLKTVDFVYETAPFAFIPNLSILDVLMWNAPEVVRNALKTTATVVEAA